jgi:hypothetical protein
MIEHNSRSVDKPVESTVRYRLCIEIRSTMRKPKTKLRQRVSRLVDRLGMAMSAARRVDGIWVGSWSSRPEEDLQRVEAALSLIREYSPLDYKRIVRELKRIWVSLEFYGVGSYKSSLKTCTLDERYVANPQTSVERIASTIVHEATHARLERHGIEYKEDLRTRIEAICFRRERAFAIRLPNSSELQQGIARYIDWYSNPEYFSNATFRKNHEAGGLEALRYLKASPWFIRAVTALNSIRRI